ncbi:MAG: zinc-dependent alcohol dehydrogenase [Spirochaetota bacterium]
MKAVVWNGPFDMSLQEVPVPEPSKGEVLIRTKAVGICGSDLEVYTGRFKQSKPPLILGHEGGGIVYRVGEEVSKVKEGDRVAVECIIYCGSCEYCRQGRVALCDNEKVLGMIGAQGEYAEYFVAPEKNCHIIPDEISWPEAGLIDTLAGPSYAIEKMHIPLNGTVAVFGPGPAGLFFCALAKIKGASRVYLVGTREYRLKYGPLYGADVLINAGENDPVSIIKNDTGGRGVDCVIEAAGSEKAFNEGLLSLKKGGFFLLYGVFGAGPISVDVQPIQIYEFTVTGTATVSYEPAIKLIKSGEIKVKELITHRFKIDDLPQAFESGLIEKRVGNYMKGVVLF